MLQVRRGWGTPPKEEQVKPEVVQAIEVAANIVRTNTETLDCTVNSIAHNYERMLEDKNAQISNLQNEILDLKSKISHIPTVVSATVVSSPVNPSSNLASPPKLNTGKPVLTAVNPMEAFITLLNELNVLDLYLEGQDLSFEHLCETRVPSEYLEDSLDSLEGWESVQEIWLKMCEDNNLDDFADFASY